MGYYDNPVSKPEDFGFVSTIGEIDLSQPDYSFDLLVVLEGKDGYYLSTDSGCSCPSPWESHTADDFTGPLTAEQAKEEITSLSEGAYGGVYDAEERDALLAQLTKEF